MFGMKWLSLTLLLAIFSLGLSQPAPVTSTIPPEPIEIVPEPVPEPLWMTAWGGDTPATRPDLAEQMSQYDSTAYAAWLQSTLTSGTVEKIRVKATSYCPCAHCCGERTELTATGRDTDEHPYGIAADFKRLAKHTQLHVPGYLTRSCPGGVWDVDDTGGAMRQSGREGITHIDVRFKDHATAKAWGVKWLWVYRVL